jgi:hypothetical protein
MLFARSTPLPLWGEVRRGQIAQQRIHQTVRLAGGFLFGGATLPILSNRAELRLRFNGSLSLNRKRMVDVD